MVDSGQTQLALNTAQVPDKVEHAREALKALDPTGDVEYISKLDALSTELMSRFALSGNADDLDEAILVKKEILDLSPPGHFFHLGALSNAAQVLVKRFKFRGDAGDLTEAISYAQTAVDACAPEQPAYNQLVGNLSNALLGRYRAFGDVADLDRIIDGSSFALSTGSAKSPHQDALLNNWATALRERFEKLGNREDLDTALKHYKTCLDLRPIGHPLRRTVLANLAEAMVCRYEVDGRLQDVEGAADLFASALQLLSPGEDGFVSCLTSLGLAFLHLFNAQGDVERLNMAIGCYQTAITYSNVPNFDHSRLLNHFAAALRTRYKLSGNVTDLNQAIQYLTTYSDITPSTSSGWPFVLLIFGAALLERFDVTSNISDLDSSIEKVTSALQLCNPGHQQRPAILSLYGCALAARFKAKSKVEDLDLAMSMCKDALSLSSPTNLQFSSMLANLSMVLHDCCFYKGHTEETQTLIDHCDHALASTPPISPGFVILKSVRAQAFYLRSWNQRELTDVNISIEGFREIIATLPEGHAEYMVAHRNLALALHARFQMSSDFKDLDESVSFYRVAHRHCPRDNANYVHICMLLGNALRESFGVGHDDALDEAIVLLAEAEKIFSATPEHIDYRASLHNLGIALFVRHQAQQSRADLDAAVENLSRALTLPAFSEGYLLLFALATVLLARYDEHGDLEDLERSVELFCSSAEQMPPKHIARLDLCRNYGDALVKLADHRDRSQYLDTAIYLYATVTNSLPPSHIDQFLTRLSLVKALFKRDDADSMSQAIKFVYEAIRVIPKDFWIYQDFCQICGRLGMSMHALSGPEALFYLEEGFKYYEKAADYSHFRSSNSVDLALEWVEKAEQRGHSSALRAYQICLDSLNQHLLSTAFVKSRRTALLAEHWVQRTSTLATDATACAIARGEVALAVELSEQGRGLLWSQMAQSRTPLDTLRQTGDVGRGLASDFERVSTQLAQSSISEPRTFVTASRLTVEEAARRYKQLSKELEDIVTRIRQQDGFQSFLDRPTFQSLQHAALAGPVILVNVARRRCDAIIVLHNAPPRLVHLTTTLEDLTTLSEGLSHTLKTTSRVGEEKLREKQLVVILRTLWDTVVSPIADELAGFLPRGARIWWCPTSKLTSLPLHAAGPYRKGAQNLANMYISSYTPTLAALIRSRDQPSSASDRTHTAPPPAFVAIGQATPSSSSSSKLQTVDAEIDLVRSLLPASMPFSALSGKAGTAAAALTALDTHGWAHLACHGHPKVEQPFDSSFALGDRAVTVLDIIGGRSEHAVLPEFAFLSACHTAVGDRQAPDEIIHLASAMQFAGFRSVIGTMWAVDDAMVMAMVKAFYTHMFSEQQHQGKGGAGKDATLEPRKGELDCTQAARALNKASKSVDKDVVTLDQRIVFIHIGV